MRESKLRCVIVFVCLLAMIAGVFPAEKAQASVASDGEFRAVWFSYFDYEKVQGKKEAKFTKYMSEVFDNAVELGMNAVVVHVRPFSDAIYESKYFPWSKYISGKQGKALKYDPLEIMVELAHERGLKIHAWINPYRITSGSTDITQLAEDNPARIWLTDDDESNDRNVLSYGGSLYYNPSKAEVRKLIVNGVKEIVKNYDVDGIHFDDYFYPSLGNNFGSLFDAQEYQEYAADRISVNKKTKTIVEWRKDNVNTLIKSVYNAVKKIDSDVVFGISPGGYIDYFDEDTRWYVDYRTWMGTPGYVDYICPQLYWTFNTLNTYPFLEVLAKWQAVERHASVKLYIGIPVYKLNENVVVGSNYKVQDTEWYNPHLIHDMIVYSRRTNDVDGYIFFDYRDMIKKANAEAMGYLMECWE